MNLSCSQCDFTTQFESAMTMHHQLHHDTPDVEDFMDFKAMVSNQPKGLFKYYEKSQTVPRGSSDPPYLGRKEKGLRLGSRTSSATRLFGKLRARICRSKMLFPHPEENLDVSTPNFNADISTTSDCTSKALKDTTMSRITTCLRDTQKETYGCHLCAFDADRITVLDRHLLNDHRIGLENLLKLVLAKTKDGLADENVPTLLYGVRQPYYKIPDEIIEEGEFVIETVTPKIKILKHAATNTDLQWCDIPDLKDNCRLITQELDKLIKYPIEKYEKDQLLDKMQTLNECMCKFVDSSNTLKKVLTKEFETGREQLSGDEPMFELGLGDQDTPREWQRAHSEKMERNKHRHIDRSTRGDRGKLTSESFYF